MNLTEEQKKRALDYYNSDKEYVEDSLAADTDTQEPSHFLIENPDLMDGCHWRWFFKMLLGKERPLNEK